MQLSKKKYKFEFIDGKYFYLGIYNAQKHKTGVYIYVLVYVNLTLQNYRNVKTGFPMKIP